MNLWLYGTAVIVIVQRTASGNTGVRLAFGSVDGDNHRALDIAAQSTNVSPALYGTAVIVIVQRTASGNTGVRLAFGSVDDDNHRALDITVEIIGARRKSRT
jgi:hypothetical protein